MSDEELRARFRAALNASPAPPLETTRKFLRLYCQDAGDMEEVRRQITRMSGVNDRTLRQGLAGIQGLLADASHDPDLVRLIEIDTGWVLEQPTVDAARAWLGELERMLREACG
jgi:hypothetical protein